MSIPQKATITCPHCGNPYSVTIFVSINTDYIQDLPKRIIDGSWFDAVCPICHKTVSLEYDVLYHDMIHHAMVWLISKEYSPDYKRRIMEIRSSYHAGNMTRLVLSKGELREKVACLEKGRDDRVIELCKAFMLEQLMETVPDFEVNSVFYSIVENKEVIFFYDKSGKAIHSFLEDTLYNILKGQFVTELSGESSAYPFFDITWAKQMLASNRNKEPDPMPGTKKPDIPITIPKKNEPQKESHIEAEQQRQVMFCRKCGKKLPEDSDFCQYCGTKIVIIGGSTIKASNVDRSQSYSKNKAVFQIGEYAQAFLRCYKKAIDLCEKKLFNPEYKEELLPALFVVIDYAALSAQKDRRKVADEIIPEISKHFTQTFSPDVFRARVDLYGEIIRGKSLRAVWLYGNSSMLDNDPITRIGGLLGDILFNPACAIDYDNAPIALVGIQEQLDFGQQVMWPLISELADLFKNIYAI